MNRCSTARTTLLFMFVFTSLQFPQVFFGVSYNNGNSANFTNLTQIKKITFSGGFISFETVDNSIAVKDILTIAKLMYSSFDGGSPLPVELTSFLAEVAGEKVIIKWASASEVDNYGFNIERNDASVNNPGAWGKIGFVKGAGYSNSPKEYSFTDLPKGAVKIWYRLKIIDNSGKFEHSTSIEVIPGIHQQYTLKQNFPNPFNPQTSIAYNMPLGGRVNLKVYDALGNEIAALVNEYKEAGSYEAVFNSNTVRGGLSSGIYICKMNAGKFSGSIKMLIVK